MDIIIILVQDGRGDWNEGTGGWEGEDRKLVGRGGAGNERWVAGWLNLTKILFEMHMYFNSKRLIWIGFRSEMTKPESDPNLNIRIRSKHMKGNLMAFTISKNDLTNAFIFLVHSRLNLWSLDLKFYKI